MKKNNKRPTSFSKSGQYYGYEVTGKNIASYHMDGHWGILFSAKSKYLSKDVWKLWNGIIQIELDYSQNKKKEKQKSEFRVFTWNAQKEKKGKLVMSLNIETKGNYKLWVSKCSKHGCIEML